MKKFRWQLIIIFLTGLVVGILLIGEQPVTQTFLKPEPVQGGIYTEALVGDLQRLNPLLDFYNSVDRDVDRLVFSSLIQFDERGLPQPDLAESWGISKDGTIYNFTLREGILWHDDVLLTTDDVIFTIELLREGGITIPADLQMFWQDVEVKRLNEHNLQFQLPEPFAPFLDYLSFGILPEHMLGDLSFEQMVDSAYNLQPVGSGPFRFESLIVENGQIEGLILTSNNDYYGKAPYIDQVIFRYYPDAAAALLAYQEGLVQGISEVSSDALTGVLAEPDLAVYSGRKPEITMIFLNLDNPEVPFFADATVRRALLMGINRQWMIDHVLDGQAVISDLPILPGTWAYYDGIPQLDYDPDQANALLKDAGYPVSGDEEAVRMMEEIPFHFTLYYPDDKSGYAELAEAVQKSWESLSIQVTIEGVPYEQLVNEHLDAREYQAALVDLNLARSPDPDPYPFWSQVQAIGGQNYSQWDHRMASEYLEQARVTHDLTERARLYNNFQAVFSQELPALPMFYPVYVFAVDYQVQGVRVGPLFDSGDRFAAVEEWFLEARYLTQQNSAPTSENTE